MKNVDYVKLAEQYANFLVAVGGVSITALTLVLSLRRKAKKTERAAERVARAFLVAALSVSTVCCFIGAQMMAETAAAISFLQKEESKLLSERQLSDERQVSSERKPSGERLFLLASTNIFMAAVLVLFALMLLPTVSGEKQAANLAAISVSVFALIVLGALCWMFRAAVYRMSPPGGWPVIDWAITVSILWGVLLAVFIRIKLFLTLSFFIKVSKLIPRKAPGRFMRKLIYLTLRLACNEKLRIKYLLIATFIPIIIFTVTSLLWFAWVFGDAGGVNDSEIFFFTLAVTFSYISLIIASIKIMHDNRAEARARRRMRAAA